MLKDFIHEPGAFASALAAAAIKMLGAECVQWDPVALRMELKDLTGREPSDLNMDRLNAAFTVIGNDVFLRSVGAFCAVVTAFNFNKVPAGVLAVPDSDDLMWGATEAALLLDTENPGYCPDIQALAGAVLSFDGVTSPPDILSFAVFDPRESDNRTSFLSSDPMAFEAYNGRQQEELKAMWDKTNTNMTALTGQLKAVKTQSS